MWGHMYNNGYMTGYFMVFVWWMVFIWFVAFTIIVVAKLNKIIQLLEKK